MEYNNVYLIYLCTFLNLCALLKAMKIQMTFCCFDTKTAKHVRYFLYVGRNVIISYILTIFTAYSWLSFWVRVYTMTLKSHRPAAYTIWLRENGQHVDKRKIWQSCCMFCISNELEMNSLNKTQT